MILKGSQRSGAYQLADHLMNDLDNDHVEVAELRGFIAGNLHGALTEVHAISKATECKQYLFSLSLNPPSDHIASNQELIDAADRAEKELGLSDQPRAIVIHEKEGRRHAHCVWSRIDGVELKSVRMSHFKRKLTALTRELYLENDWKLPEGLRTHGGKNPLNFTLAEWQQSKRLGVDPREIKQIFREAWTHSDGLKGLQNALQERGYFLAKGDRRGFVALDVEGNIYSLAKWSGVRAKDVKSKLGSPDHLNSVDAMRKDIRSRVSKRLKSFIADVKDKHRRDLEPLQFQKREMVTHQRRERTMLHDSQKERWIAESKTRFDRLNTGLRGFFDRLSGQHKTTIKRNEAEAYQCLLRDRKQQDDLISAQLVDRRTLRDRFDVLRLRHKQDRKILARDIAHFMRDLRGLNQVREQDHNRSLEPPTNQRRKDGPDLTP